MRQVLIPVLMTALLLTGCGSEAKWQEALDAKRVELCAAGEIDFTAELTADTGDAEFRFTVECTHGEGETVMEITQPELIAGIRARVSEEDASVEYDGAELSIGPLAEGNIAPVSALPTVLDALKNGHVTQLWVETDNGTELLAVRTYLSDSEYVLLWLRTDTLTPVHAEIVSGETAVIRCDIKDFTFQ